MNYYNNEEMDNPMKKVKHYLTFILWAFSSVIVTILAFIILPVLLIWEISDVYIRKGALTIVQASL
jgi:hypothetical protein